MAEERRENTDVVHLKNSCRARSLKLSLKSPFPPMILCCIPFVSTRTLNGGANTQCPGSFALCSSEGQIDGFHRQILPATSDCC